MYKYCPMCGNGLVYAVPERDDRKRHLCKQCGYIIYRNPKPTSSGFIVEDGKILLTKRAFEPYKDFWDIPGGFIEFDESPEEALVREFQEELNIDVEIKSFLSIHMDDYGNSDFKTLNVFYLVNHIGGQFSCGSDVAEYGWFSFDDLPERLAFDCTTKALSDLKKLSH